MGCNGPRPESQPLRARRPRVSRVTAFTVSTLAEQTTAPATSRACASTDLGLPLAGEGGHVAAPHGGDPSCPVAVTHRRVTADRWTAPFAAEHSCCRQPSA
jgi:hypothetical protein